MGHSGDEWLGPRIQQCPSVNEWPGLHSLLVTVGGVVFSRVSWSSLGSDIWDSAPTFSMPSSETSANLRPAPFGNQVRGSLRVADDFPVGGFHAGNNE